MNSIHKKIITKPTVVEVKATPKRVLLAFNSLLFVTYLTYVKLKILATNKIHPDK
jgi:hypothetical protein